MKLRLLLIALLFWGKVAIAEGGYPAKITVSEYYTIDQISSRQLYDNENYLVLNAYYLGIRDCLAFEYILSPEKVECINRPLRLWKDVVFDDYKQNKINGTDTFYTTFIRNIYTMCKLNYD